MEIAEAIDQDIVDGWDKDGIHCWSMHKMDSLEFVEKNSEHVCLVDRTFSDGKVINMEFRKYTNKFGNERFIMFDADDGMESQLSGNQLNVHITDGNCFRRFCDGMLECGEISAELHDVLVESITPSEASELDEIL